MQRTLVLSLVSLVSACATPDAPASHAVPTLTEAAARSGKKRAFEIPDFYRVKQVGAPALAPGGNLVAFQVRRYDLERDKSWTEIWLTDLDGKNPRQMTQGEHQDTAPQFTLDGESILFSSDRSGASQVWSMPIDGGEPRQLTKFALGV